MLRLAWISVNSCSHSSVNFEWVLVHVEVQSQQERDFAERMFWHDESAETVGYNGVARDRRF